MHRVIAEEEAHEHDTTLDTNNVTVDTLSHTPITPNTQGENENAILTSERLDKSDSLAEMLNNLTVNDVGYYESDSENANHPGSDPEVAIHTSEGKKRKVKDTSNRNLH